MRNFLPCPSSCIPGQAGEGNFPKNNCTYPNRKAGSCKKGAGEAWNRRLWHRPFLTAVSGSNTRRWTTSWKPHISVQLYSGREAAGSCWYNPPRTDWNRPNGWGKGKQDMLPSPSLGLSLLSLFLSWEPQYERDKGSLHACFIEEVWNWHPSSGQQSSLLTAILLIKIFVSQKQQGLRRNYYSRLVFSNVDNQK